MSDDDTNSSYYRCQVHSSMKGNLSFLYSTVNSAEYNFYYGGITLSVSQDFGLASYYCYYHGYMGGDNRLKYISSSSEGSVYIVIQKSRTVLLDDDGSIQSNGNFLNTHFDLSDYSKDILGNTQELKGGYGYSSNYKVLFYITDLSLIHI